MRRVVVLYGNTCTAKSSLGMRLTQVFDASYLSFGDLKRAAIESGTAAGREIEAVLARGCPIDPEVGFSLLNDAPNWDLAFVSGYPISPEERDVLVASGVSILGAIHLVAEAEVLRRRFFARAVCPVCRFPGTRGGSCPEHRTALRERLDNTEEEFQVRQKLYHERILPFFNREIVGNFPYLELSAENSLSRLVQSARDWVLRMEG